MILVEFEAEHVQLERKQRLCAWRPDLTHALPPVRVPCAPRECGSPLLNPSPH